MSKEIIEWIKEYITYCVGNHTHHKTAQEVRDCVFSALRDVVCEQSRAFWEEQSEMPWEIKVSYSCRVSHHEQCSGCDCSCHKEKSE